VRLNSAKVRETLSDIHLTGPLNLNRLTKKATTAMGAELILDEKEFDALEMLAAHEGEPLSLETIYRAVWGDAGDGACDREAARSGLSNLIRQVDKAGKGFIWIEHNPNTGYNLQTRWAHNWKDGAK